MKKGVFNFLFSSTSPYFFTFILTKRSAESDENADEKNDLREKNRNLSNEILSLKKQIHSNQTQATKELEGYIFVQQTKVSELEEINRVLRGMIDDKNGHIERLMEEKKKNLTDELRALKGKNESDMKNGEIGKDVSEEKIKKIEENNKFLETKVKFFLNEIEKLVKNEQTLEKKIEEKNKTIQEILIEKQKLIDKTYKSEQERLGYMKEVKKSNETITELTNQLESEKLSKQELEKFLKGIHISYMEKKFVLNFKN